MINCILTNNFYHSAYLQNFHFFTVCSMCYSLSYLKNSEWSLLWFSWKPILLIINIKICGYSKEITQCIPATSRCTWIDGGQNVMIANHKYIIARRVFEWWWCWSMWVKKTDFHFFAIWQCVLLMQANNQKLVLSRHTQNFDCSKFVLISGIGTIYTMFCTRLKPFLQLVENWLRI